MFSEAIQKYSLCRAAWSQTDPNGIEKIYSLLEINAITKFSLFRVEYIIDGGCLFDD